MIIQAVNCYLAAASGLGSRWRVNVSAKANGGSFITAKEIEFRQSAGGADAATSGTATASVNSGTAGNAFDDNTGTIWSAGTTAVPQWIEYQFPGVVTIEQLAWTPSATGDMPTVFTVEYYNGSGWTTYWSEATFRVQNNSQLIFTRDDPLIAGHSRWRLYITATQNSSFWPEVDELELRTSVGGADETSAASANGGNAICSQDGGGGVEAWLAFNDGAGRWLAGALAPQWIGYRLPVQKDVVEVSIKGPSDSRGAPKDFAIQYWDQPSSTWVTSRSLTGQVWTASEIKVFTTP